MAFADPQSVTVAGNAKSLARIPSPDNIGRFSNNGGEFLLEIVQNNTQNRFNRAYKLSQTKVAADPISSVNKEVTATVLLTINEPRWGFSDTELVDLLTAAVTAISASTYAAGKKLLEGEA